MSLVIIEGARLSGKSYLAENQNILPTFKFDFNQSFSDWDFRKDSKDIHNFGLGKEVMLHQLNKDGFIRDKVLIDRGILTNSVWGIFQNRIDLTAAKKDLKIFKERGLFEGTQIIYVEGEYKESREKDIWDSEDKKRSKEKEIFTFLLMYLDSLNVKINTFNNEMNESSLEAFKILLKQL